MGKGDAADHQILMSFQQYLSGKNPMSPADAAAAAPDPGPAEGSNWVSLDKAHVQVSQGLLACRAETRPTAQGTLDRLQMPASAVCSKLPFKAAC